MKGISQPISGIERRFLSETLCFDPMNKKDMGSLFGFGLPRDVVVSTLHMYGMKHDILVLDKRRTDTLSVCYRLFFVLYEYQTPNNTFVFVG